MQFKTIQEVDVPEIGLGTHQLIGREAENIVKLALNLGYRHIDTAQSYKNEREVGEAIKRSHVDREEIFLTSKIWYTDLEKKDVLKIAEESLRVLDTPYLDLLLVHWPNPEVDIEKTMEAFLSLRDQGKVLNIGVANYPLKLLKELNEELAAPIFCNQVEYHPFISQLDLLDYTAEEDILFTSYAPLAQGKVLDDPLLQELGKKYGKSPAQIALRWLIEQEQVVAIPKASSEEHLKENLDVFDFVLEDDDFYAIDDIEKNTRLVDPDFAPEWDV
ncbi:MAG: aldo/keto reductase [Balneolaceae bacterium]